MQARRAISPRMPGSSSIPMSSKKEPLTAERFHSAACRAHDAHDLPAAIQLYSTAIDLDHAQIKSWIGRGVARKEAGLYELSISDYTQALKLSESDSTTLLILSNRANCYTAAGQFPAALIDHNSAISLNKHNDAVLWANRGSTLLKMGRLDDAARDFEASINVDPAYAVAYYNLGLVHGRQGRISECVKCFERASALFKHSHTNSIHAQDCEREIAFFTGQKNSFSPTHRNTHSIEMSAPFSPLHQKGITRSSSTRQSASSTNSSSTFAQQQQQQVVLPGATPRSRPPSLTPSPLPATPSPNATPSATPSSRGPLYRSSLPHSDGVEEGSSLFEISFVQAQQAQLSASMNGASHTQDRYLSSSYDAKDNSGHNSNLLSATAPPAYLARSSPNNTAAAAVMKTPPPHANSTSPPSSGSFTSPSPGSDDALLSPTAKKPLLSVKPTSSPRSPKSAVRIHMSANATHSSFTR